MAQIITLITKLLGPPESIGDGDRGLAHLQRWTILKSKRYKLYLHHSLGGRLNGDLNKDPEQFVSIGFAESQDANRPQSFPDGPAWMLLIGKSS